MVNQLFNVFSKLMNLKKVYINWQRYAVYEDLSVVRCFKCQQYYHKSENCPNKEVCEYCTGEHHIKECPKSIKKCANCSWNNNNYNVNYNVNHEANNPECPSYKYLLNILRGKIDYGNENGF